MMMVDRSFSLGRRGEAQWERLRAAYELSERRGEIVLVTSDSRDVRAEVRRRLESIAPRVDVIVPSQEVAGTIDELAKSGPRERRIPVAWIEAQDSQWVEALTALNRARDLLQASGPCQVVLAGPTLLHDLVARCAPDLASFIAIELRLDEVLEELVSAPGTLTWVHLSDLHVHREDWQQDHVLRELVRGLPGLLEERALQPDLLFVTGDIASQGQRQEYDGASIVLEEITKALGLDRQQVFVVAGNHDVDRRAIGGMAKGYHGALLGLGPDELREAVGELLGDASEFALYGKRLAEWCAFTDRFLGRARSVSVDRPWRSDVVEVRGLKVGILSSCTVWASGPDDAKGRLILGERQLHDLLAEVRDGGGRLNIALMHHPLHWLHDGEHSAIRGRLEREVDIVLHGHTHDAHSALYVAAGSAHVVQGGGAAYAELGQDAYHGFSVAQLDVGAGRLAIDHFTWSTRSGKWCADTGAPGANDRGRVVLPFSPAGLGAVEPRRNEHEVLATRLRRAAARVYATVDFAGLGAGGPRRHVTLDQIFVPLELEATELPEAETRWFRPEDVADLADEVEPEAYEYISGRITLGGLEAMLAEGRNVVVLGDPGSGKSTLARYLASMAARREDGPVPVLLTVRAWITRSEREELLEMAARQATEVLSVRTDHKALEELCQQGNVLLIIDGVDEAADPAVRRDLRDRIHGFVEDKPNVSVLVTTRIAGYHEVALDDGFDELRLESFDDEAIEDFVRRWYDLVEDDPSERVRKRADLLHALEAEPRVKALARNPLLATLIGMVHFSHAKLPGERAKLYGKIVELMLVTWPAERRRELAELHGTVQQPMLEKLALRLQEQRAEASSHRSQAEVLVTFPELEDMLVELLNEQFPERGPHEQRYLAHKWGNWLVDESGLLPEQQPGQVGFLHLSLMEYLAGRALYARHLGRGYGAIAAVVAERHDISVWEETLLLMLGSENKNRELGLAVIDRLLTASERKPPWSACVFAIAMLREEVDVGPRREYLLEVACRSASLRLPHDWYGASERLGAVVRFSRAHGVATRRFLQAKIAQSSGEQLIGALALSGVALPWAALPWEDAKAQLDARENRYAAAATLLDFGPHRREGIWAREQVTKAIYAAWASATHLGNAMLWSLDGCEPLPWPGLFEARAAWIAPLLARAKWMARTIGLAAERLEVEPREHGHRGLPSVVTWAISSNVNVTVHLPTAMVGIEHDEGEHLIGIQGSSLGTPQEISSHFAQDLAQEVAGNLEHIIHRNRGFSAATSASFVGHFATNTVLPPDLFIARRLHRYIAQEYSQWFSPELAWELASDFRREFEVHLPSGLHRNFPLSFGDDLTFQASVKGQSASATDLLHRLCMEGNEGKADFFATHLLLFLIAEVHAGLVTSPDPNDVEHVTDLMTLRLQNRWLNLFFTPLVEHATQNRPLETNPDLHALLLTYGLIQYQTTWQWPDCPHWRSWFAGTPPDHWLPAHVWHLVRSIQNPEDPTHRAQATAALDRNDWPELAQSLRGNTLIPTPPEVLALFDRGEPTNDPQPTH